MSQKYLRNHQSEACRKAHAWSLRETQGDAVVVHPTGSGKSVTMTAMARTSQKKTLVLVHRVDLVDQLTKTLKDSSVWMDGPNLITPLTAVGKLQSENTDIPTGAQVVVCSLDTLLKAERMKTLLKSFTPDCVYVDEAHHRYSTDNTKYDKVLGKLRAEQPALSVVNFTGTNYLSDPRVPLAMGEILSEYRLGDLVAAHVLHPTIYIPLPTAAAKSENRSREWADTLASIPNMQDRRTVVYMPDAVSAQTVLPELQQQGLRFLALTSEYAADLKRATDIVPDFEDWLVDAGKVLGANANQRSNYMLAVQSLLYAERGIHGVCNFDRATEGLDIPCLDTAVNFRPLEDAYFKLIQIMGRTTRKFSVPDEVAQVLTLRQENVRTQKAAGSEVYDFASTWDVESSTTVPSERTLLSFLAVGEKAQTLEDVMCGSFKNVAGEMLTLAQVRSLFPNATPFADIAKERPYFHWARSLGCNNLAQALLTLEGAGYRMGHLPVMGQQTAEWKQLAKGAEQITQGTGKSAEMWKALQGTAQGEWAECTDQELYPKYGEVTTLFRYSEQGVPKFTMAGGKVYSAKDTESWTWEAPSVKRMAFVRKAVADMVLPKGGLISKSAILESVSMGDAAVMSAHLTGEGYAAIVAVQPPKESLMGKVQKRWSQTKGSLTV